MVLDDKEELLDYWCIDLFRYSYASDYHQGSRNISVLAKTADVIDRTGQFWRVLQVGGIMLNLLKYVTCKLQELTSFRESHNPREDTQLKMGE